MRKVKINSSNKIEERNNFIHLLKTRYNEVRAMQAAGKVVRGLTLEATNNPALPRCFNIMEEVMKQDYIGLVRHFEEVGYFPTEIYIC